MAEENYGPADLLRMLGESPDDKFRLELIAAFFARERSAGKVEAVQTMQAMIDRRAVTASS